MSDPTTDQKPYVNSTREMWRMGRYRLVTTSHRAHCNNARFMRNPQPADKPAAELGRCCRVET